jgi:PAS domain S-box-containing protein
MGSSNSPPHDAFSRAETTRQRTDRLQREVVSLRRGEERWRAREQQLRRQNAALVELSQSQAIGRGDLDVAFRQLTRVAAETMAIERVGIWLFNSDRSAIRCVDLYERSIDRHSDGLELAAADFPAYFRALEADRTIAADDAVHDARTREFADSYLKPIGITSMMDAPIRIGSRTIGIVCHEQVGPPRQWSSENQAFAGSIADFAAITLQARERELAELAVRESEQLLSQIIDLVPHMIFATDRAGRLILANRAVGEACGIEASELLDRERAELRDARPWLEPLTADDREVLRAGREHIAPEMHFTDASGSHRILHVTRIPFRTAGAEERAILTVAIDITERKHAEERQALMMRELNHRVKNNLAAVMSIAKQTLDHAESQAEFTTAFTGRIQSLAVAHDMLASSDWQGADLRALVERVIAPYRMDEKEHIMAAGPAVMLPAGAAPSVSMALHELLANAAKYGALSVPDGRVSLEWSLIDDSDERRVVRMVWKESDGPPIETPAKRGFGIEFIESAIAYQLRGCAEVTFEPGGVRCMLEIPLRAEASEESSLAPDHR